MEGGGGSGGDKLAAAREAWRDAVKGAKKARAATLADNKTSGQGQGSARTCLGRV